MKKTNAHILISALTLSAMALVGCTDEAAMIESESSELASVGQASERHCTIEVSSQRDGAPAVKGRAEPRCYPSFAEAISAATKGAVRLAPDATPDMFEQRDAEQAATLGTHVVGVEYGAPHWDAFWGSMTFTSSVPCNGYTTMWVDEMPWGWNDVISSSLTYAGCQHAWHYEHSYQRGVDIDCLSEGCYEMGAMNDHTSSIRWR